MVESVYPGERYGDVAIAEVLFPLLEEDLEAAVLLPGTGDNALLNSPRSWAKPIYWAIGITAAVSLLVVILLVGRHSQIVSKPNKKENNR